MGSFQIKFRAWDKTMNMMIYQDDTKFEFRLTGKGVEVDDLTFVDTVFNEKHEDIDCEVMQYTGLKDKNGLEVYFNDVAEDEYGHRYEVVFEGDCLRCNGIRKIRGGHKPKNRRFGIDLEIIGNRFENPKLLEEEE